MGPPTGQIPINSSRVLMTLFDSPSFAGHEGVHAFHDSKTGLKAIVAVHSTARGPAVGGCRMWNYATAEEALTDVLRLSRGMSYKNAVADLEIGHHRRRQDPEDSGAVPGVRAVPEHPGRLLLFRRGRGGVGG